MSNFNFRNFQKTIDNLQAAVDNHPRVSNSVVAPAKELLPFVRSFIEYHRQTTTRLSTEIDNYKKQISDLNNINELKFQKIIDKLESEPHTIQTTSATTQNNPQKPNFKTVLVKPKNNLLSPTEVKEAICNTVSTLDIKCNQVSINKTNVAFKFPNESSKNEFINRVSNDPNFNQALEAYEPTPKCPTIVLKNLDYSTNESEIVNQLIIQNDLDDLDNHIKLLFTIKKRYYFDAVLCISPHMFNKLQQRTLYLGWTACNAEETFLLGHCSNCLNFQHRTSTCPNKNNKKCKKCGLSFSTIRRDHQQSEFSTHIKNCANHKCCLCLEKNLPTDHAALSDQCPIYQKKVRFIKDRTCYDGQKEVKFFNRPLPNTPSNTHTTSPQQPQQQSRKNSHTDLTPPPKHLLTAPTSHLHRHSPSIPPNLDLSTQPYTRKFQ
ncbi:hypothetical protein BLA29_002517 [Euroglyphus maynei]|uniref:Uncharacterized protein n=1 Tax=Euroglyphus maynei TaxID=6958 RepID=A0A1Y3B911_EURMA|nr:hypothetical protein BLA29_002517 [Euroglyphus maynei]